MTLPLTGGCQCGALRYEITETPRLTYACHCTDCQRMTSSAFSMAIVVSEIAFRLTKGEPRSIQRTADSGHVTTRWVCPDCGSWICGAPRASSATPCAVRRARRSGRHIGRHFLAGADGAFLDAQQAALGRLAGEQPQFRDSAGGLSRVLCLGRRGETRRLMIPRASELAVLRVSSGHILREA
jgi:hypothetical protein